jgi:hypothetical protein
MNNSQLAHVWAQQEKVSGKASNMFFEGKSIFSYGHHFEIARFINDSVVLFTTQGYSNSTAKHKNHVLNAIRHKQVICVPYVDAQHKKNIEYFESEAAALAKAAKNAKKNGDLHLSNLSRLCDGHRDYIKLFKLKFKALSVSDFINEDDLKVIEKKSLEYIEKEKQRHAKEAEKHWQKLNLWIDGADVDTFGFYTLPVRLRIKDDYIETSHGAKVSLEDAKKFWYDYLRQNIKAGYRVGDFTIDSIELDTFKIGCHEIPHKEVNRIGILIDQ